MTRLLLRRSAIGASFTVLPPPPPPPGGALWTADFETGSFSQIESQQESSADRISLITSNPLEGAYSVLIKCGPQDQGVAGSGSSLRTEMALATLSTRFGFSSLEGRQTWLTFKAKLLSTWQYGTSFTQITQILGATGSYWPVFQILANGPSPGIMYAAVRGSSADPSTLYPNDSALRTQAMLNPFPMNQMLRFKIHHEWSLTSSGRVRVYIDNVLRATITGANFWRGFDTTFYWKSGIYRGSSGITQDSHIVVDAFRMWASDPGDV